MGNPIWIMKTRLLYRRTIWLKTGTTLYKDGNKRNEVKVSRSVFMGGKSERIYLSNEDVLDCVNHRNWFKGYLDGLNYHLKC